MVRIPAGRASSEIDNEIHVQRGLPKTREQRARGRANKEGKGDSAVLISERNSKKHKVFVRFHNLYEKMYEKNYEKHITKNIVRKSTK